MLGHFQIDREYIRQHFSDILGEDVRLLDEENGLEILSHKVRERLARYYH